MNRTVLLIAAALLPAGSPGLATAQSGYPAQPIHFIVTTAPGGGLDTFARMSATELTKRAGQQVVVENRPGAGTTIGTAAVARAKPDGYTVLVNTSSFAISPALYKSIAYDPIKDFIPIMMGVATPNLMVVHPSVPVKSVKDMIALAKAGAARGDPILYASGGTGTNGHLAVALFESLAKVKMTHVPYRSGSLGVIDLLAGQVSMMTDSMSSVLPYVRAGRLRALGVSSAERAPAAPEIPTIAEAGVPGYESGQWYGFFVPAGTPRAVTDWLHRELTAVLRTEATKERLATRGLDVVADSPAKFAARVKSDLTKWTKVVKDVGIPPL